VNFAIYKIEDAPEDVAAFGGPRYEYDLTVRRSTIFQSCKTSLFKGLRLVEENNFGHIMASISDLPKMLAAAARPIGEIPASSEASLEKLKELAKSFGTIGEDFELREKFQRSRPEGTVPIRVGEMGTNDPPPTQSWYVWPKETSPMEKAKKLLTNPNEQSEEFSVRCNNLSKRIKAAIAMLQSEFSPNSPEYREHVKSTLDYAEQMMVDCQVVIKVMHPAIRTVGEDHRNTEALVSETLGERFENFAKSIYQPSVSLYDQYSSLMQ